MARACNVRLVQRSGVLATAALLLIAGTSAGESCCLPDGACLAIPEVLCTALGGTHDPEHDCVDGGCPLGACCHDGGCTQVALAACVDLGGTWAGAGVPCDALDCVTGACCFTLKGFPLDCDDAMTQGACEAEGGSWLGAGSACADGACIPVGACCIASTGTCMMLTEDACLADSAANEWNGSGALCADIVCCPLDVDGDGGIGFGDLVAVLTAWGVCGDPCPADLDHSGHVTIADLLLVLANWGPC